MKFGGSSVKTATAMQRVASIVRSKASTKRLVVLSACGGITDLLLRAAHSAATAKLEELSGLLGQIRTHHETLCTELFEQNVPTSLQRDVDDLLGALQEYCEGISLLCECTPQSLDMVASFGERLSTCIFQALLVHQGQRCELHDARITMKSSADFGHAIVKVSELETQCEQHLLPLFDTADIVVTQGFIASTSDDRTTTLGRGGSDLSAALFGAAMRAEDIQIWTDVNGVLSADPRLVSDARTLEYISVAEMRQLAYFGAKVLHPDTIKPAVDRNIVVRILNTFEPEHPGTSVIPSREHNAAGVQALSILRNCLLLRFDAPMNQHASTLLAKKLSEALQRGVEVLMSFAEESTCALLIRAADRVHFDEREPRIEAIDVLCACGPSINGSDAMTQMSTVLSERGVVLYCVGYSNTCILSLVPSEHSVQALQTAHALLIPSTIQETVS